VNILNSKVSVLVLAVIALAIVAGNFLIDRSEPTPAAAGTESVQAGVVSSESSTLIVFNLAGEVEEQRLEEAATRMRAVADKRTKVRALANEETLLATKFKDLPGAVSRATLESIADCESGGDPKVVSSNGLYHGKYQFSPDTWESVGGKGLPSKAPEAEQDYRAALLYERSGPGQWPVCGS
jgi:hypothetical protein